ncbi:DUF2059 domain-containing protein [Gallaecimonas xiamenensis]|uniref:DUF2059 domain-containing protein n=1 Tax=Gallaecimonas xiamenensis 3-C-1 TaxID=745411 RepID=K2IHL1_9GAMM|nr:DUF2059 domain-containing protein [Gallaecimonas xiamenensis]EKE69591.1 hypothetical protein B3C1_14897 [Gallaecimonas xiamenensis 3-C-1]
MKFIKPILLASTLLLSHQALADDAAKQEAERLLEIIHMDKVLSGSIEQMLDMQLAQSPALQPYKAVMMSFMQKYMSYESVKPDMVRLYSDAFSASELKELNAFYSTPTGQKTIEQLPQLMSKGAQLGYERVQAHSDELRQMIQAESERLQALEGGKTGG